MDINNRHRQPRKPSLQSSSYNNNNKNPTKSGYAPNYNHNYMSIPTNKVSLSQENDSSDSDSLVGTCPFMCPEKERNQRERLRDLAIFERLHGNPVRTSSSLAVKKFCRTISAKDVDASDIRPLPVLEDTLSYLMELLDSSDQPFEVVHEFVFDRMRSIRQDLSMQNISNDGAICLFEKMIKFHVVSHHKLRRCEDDSTIISSIHHLNMEQLTKCLASLYYLYDVNRMSDSVFKNEAEFRSLYVLHHLDSQCNSTGESLSLWLSHLPSFIIKSKEMCFARRVLRFYRIGNYWHFFHTVASEATYLQLCVIEHYIKEVWLHAVACINSSGYKLHPYPLASLSKILMTKELDLEAFCNACGLETTQDDMGNKVLPTKQTGFSHPKWEIQCHDFSKLELLEEVTKRLSRTNIN